MGHATTSTLTFYTLSRFADHAERTIRLLRCGCRKIAYARRVASCMCRLRRPMPIGAGAEQMAMEYEHQRKKLGELANMAMVRTRIVTPRRNCPRRLPCFATAARYLGLWCCRQSHNVGKNACQKVDYLGGVDHDRHYAPVNLCLVLIHRSCFRSSSGSWLQSMCSLRLGTTSI